MLSLAVLKPVVTTELEQCIEQAQELEQQHSLLYIDHSSINQNVQFYFRLDESELKLIDNRASKPIEYGINIDQPRFRNQSYPLKKSGPLVQAIGRKTRTLIDTTAGWGQDSLHAALMGYQVTSVERSDVLGVLLTDCYQRIASDKKWSSPGLTPPKLFITNAIDYLANLDTAPDCIYLDPMFPQRGKNALPKKSLKLLREFIGSDDDTLELFNAAMQKTANRVVVKRPDHAAPFIDNPNDSFAGKTVRYDLYLKTLPKGKTERKKT